MDDTLTLYRLGFWLGVIVGAAVMGWLVLTFRSIFKGGAMLQELWQKIVDSWQIKMMCSGAVSCLTFLLGDVTAAPFVALWVLVVLDTFTRWAAIGRKTLIDNKMKGSVWDGIWLAVIEKRINSEAMRCRFQTKALAYLALLIGFNLLDIVIPDKIMGQDVVGVPNTFISTWLAFVELQSIIENLIEMGMTGLTPLGAWVSSKREKMTDAVAQQVKDVTKL